MPISRQLQKWTSCSNVHSFEGVTGYMCTTTLSPRTWAQSPCRVETVSNMHRNGVNDKREPFCDRGISYETGIPSRQKNTDSKDRTKHYKRSPMTREDTPKMMDAQQCLSRSFWPLTSSFTTIQPPTNIPRFPLALAEKVSANKRSKERHVAHDVCKSAV